MAGTRVLAHFYESVALGAVKRRLGLSHPPDGDDCVGDAGSPPKPWLWGAAPVLSLTSRCRHLGAHQMLVSMS